MINKTHTGVQLLVCCAYFSLIATAIGQMCPPNGLSPIELRFTESKYRIFLATGVLEGVRSNIIVASAIYSIDPIYGNFTTNRISVDYFHNTLKSPLPERSILILASSFGEPQIEEDADSLGGEAWRGILPDTPENRELIRKIPIAEFEQNRPENHLPKEKAISLAQHYLSQQDRLTKGQSLLVAARKPFGWRVFSFLAFDESCRHYILTCTVHVSDTGDVLGDIGAFDPPGFTAEELAEWDIKPVSTGSSEDSHY